MSRFNERKKEEGRKAPSSVMHQTGARQLRARVRWRTPVEQWDPCRTQRRLLPRSCPEPGSASPGPGAPVIVSKANPISKSLVSLLRVCAALELIVSLLLLLFKTQFGSSKTVVNARNYALRLLMLVTLFLLRIGFSPLFWRLFWSILSVCISRLIWSYVCYNMKNSLSTLQFRLLAVLNYAGGSSSVSWCK
jgi:hypothetical protein